MNRDGAGHGSSSVHQQSSSITTELARLPIPRFAPLVLLCVFVSGAADARAATPFAQAPAPVITGIAMDATGAVLPGAQVVLTPAGSGTAVQTAVSDGAGAFRLTSVAPGRYDVTVSF